MSKTILLAIVLIFSTSTFGQQTGDTILIKSLNYNSTTRDTVVSFPSNPNLKYEKILMLYSMRCKNGNVSTGANRNLGCGEWDYSCNTYITDSSKVDSILSKHPSHTISGFSGSSYSYTSQAVYDFQRFIQSNTSSTTVVSETQSTVGAGSMMLNDALQLDQNSSKSQYLFTASELTAAGLVAGDIDGLMLKALNTGSAGFVKVRIKHSTASFLSSTSVDLNGFTEVYFMNTNFTVGNNRLQFFTPFNWDGTSNLLIELSTTNSSPSLSLDIEGESTTSNMALIASNNHHLNTTGASSFTVPSSNFNTLNNELTVSFWSKGNNGVASTNTTIIIGKDGSGNRQLNIHLPWGNSQVYFDCGNDGSGYDRINKSAGTAILENEWNHWAFTKNSSTGEMKIYLNGNLWHSGNNKNRAIDLDSLTFGATENLSRIYPGNVDELRIWDKELAQSEIQNWMNKPVNNTHPDYNNLVAYYEMDEGSGSTTANSVNAQTSSFLRTPIWSYDRGVELSRLFSEKNTRPNTTFLQGTYNLLVSNDTVFDSTLVIPNLVTQYQIVSQTGSLDDDIVNAISTNSYWEATYSYVYDGATGLKIDSTAINSDGTINISDLSYYRRDPSKFEIMSFVTPYGINLDLGPAGETWVFDLTDFSPVLKGNKRMSLERGGQWQEDMDIQFLFIVGTPPRDILDIQQLWKVESRGYTGIIADEFFESRNVELNPGAQHYKIRSAVTGHGQEGEFIPRTHFINLNGGTNEFEWQAWKECGENPVYPQGGTWIYDRAGWCPGMATDVQEYNIDPFVNPGQTLSIDYGVLAASGTSNYIVNNQLVSYGSVNHTLDASIVEISGPTNRIEYGRFNALCSNPSVIIQNTGSNKLTSLTIEYWINDDQNKQTYNWTGDLDFLDKEELSLPSPWELWDAISGSENVFHVEIKNPNGGSDEYAFNNTYSTDFDLPEVLPNDFVLWFRTNNAPHESKVEMFDANGNRLFLRDQMTANTQYRDTFNLAVGCYTLKISDTDDDGINFWANNDGNGSAFIRRIAGGVVKNINPDFGGSSIFNFTVGSALSYDKLNLKTKLDLYPNPAKNEFSILGEDLGDLKVRIYNSLGQEISIPFNRSENEVKFNTSDSPRGIYSIVLAMGSERISKKLVLN